jgi:hypothetical protein
MTSPVRYRRRAFVKAVSNSRVQLWLPWLTEQLSAFRVRYRKMQSVNKAHRKVSDDYHTVPNKNFDNKVDTALRLYRSINSSILKPFNDGFQLQRLFRIKWNVKTVLKHEWNAAVVDYFKCLIKVQPETNTKKVYEGSPYLRVYIGVTELY